MNIRLAAAWKKLRPYLIKMVMRIGHLGFEKTRWNSKQGIFTAQNISCLPLGEWEASVTIMGSLVPISPNKKNQSTKRLPIDFMPPRKSQGGLFEIRNETHKAKQGTMTTYDYIGFGLVVVPLWALSLRRGQIGGRTFVAMIADLEAQGCAWDVKKKRSALLKWTSKPGSVVAMCEDEKSRAIVEVHAARAAARMKPWKLAATIWMIVGVIGVVAWLRWEDKAETNQVSTAQLP